MNFIEISGHRPPRVGGEPRTLILTHGYASGLGFFFNNYEKLAMKFDRVIAVDWPGMGGSSRHVTAGNKPPQRSALLSMLSASLGTAVRAIPLLPAEQKERLSQRIEASLAGSGDRAASFFVDALTELVEQEVPSGKFTLAGHSLGGYLSAQYALGAADRLEGLVLISPAGLQPLPPPTERLPVLGHSLFLSAAKLFWALNLTPQLFVRMYGSRGLDIVRSALQRRFSDRFKQPELLAISKYFHSITVLPAHSEVCLNALLVPVARSIPTGAPDPRRRGYSISLYARSPVWSDARLPRIRSVPVLLLYGDDDWLSYGGVEADVEELNQQGMQIQFSRVEAAGHHLYLDNVECFHATLDDWLDRKVMKATECNKMI